MAGFEVTVTGKWILAGEHAVLRASPALVFPLYSRTLRLSYVPDTSLKPKNNLNLICEGEHGEELQLLFWGVLEKACEFKKVSRNHFSGQVCLRSSIPVGAGLGASAALCVAMARWFHSLKMIREAELYEFARSLENLFHGESSGVDIAVALSGKGLHFVRNLERREFSPAWLPTWYVSYSGKRGVTSECVKKVKDLLEKSPAVGSQIDQDMKKAVLMAEEALCLEPLRGFDQLKTSIDLARSCFERWNLTEGHSDQHMKWLIENGAAAVKPTGSGGGGYVLSLWREKPSSEMSKKLIPCF